MNAERLYLTCVLMIVASIAVSLTLDAVLAALGRPTVSAFLREHPRLFFVHAILAVELLAMLAGHLYL